MQQALAAIGLITLLTKCCAIGVRSRFGTVLPELLDKLNDWLVDNLKRQRIFVKLIYKLWPVSHFFTL